MMLKAMIYAVLLTTFFAYTAIVYLVGTNTAQSLPFLDEVRAGQMLWNANNCVACHQLYGLGGFMGPDLTNIVSVKGEPYTAAFIANGTVRMPNFQLDEAEVQALIAYLRHVDSTGTSPPTTYQATWFGTVPTYSKDSNDGSRP